MTSITTWENSVDFGTFVRPSFVDRLAFSKMLVIGGNYCYESLNTYGNKDPRFVAIGTNSDSTIKLPFKGANPWEINIEVGNPEYTKTRNYATLCTKLRELIRTNKKFATIVLNLEILTTMFKGEKREREIFLKDCIVPLVSADGVICTPLKFSRTTRLFLTQLHGYVEIKHTIDLAPPEYVVMKHNHPGLVLNAQSATTTTNPTTTTSNTAGVQFKMPENKGMVYQLEDYLFGGDDDVVVNRSNFAPNAFDEEDD
jgi:hypothetical protein